MPARGPGGSGRPRVKRARHRPSRPEIRRTSRWRRRHRWCASAANRSTRPATTIAASGAAARAPTSASSASAGSACARWPTRATSPDSRSRAGSNMSMTDPIADFLTRIRNGLRADHELVDMPASKFKTELARILREQGYIEDYSTEPGRVGQVLRVRLKYTEGRQPVISGMSRVSKPGRRTYVNRGEIPKVQGGMGTTTASTSKGVRTGHEARRHG